LRRFSQRSHLVTLNEINITPLLDLAFVLLIIFIITTPLLEQGMNLKLPAKGGTADRTVTKLNIKTVEISTAGVFMLDRKQIKLDELERQLVAAFKANTNTVVYIRADENGKNKDLYEVINRCQKNGITRFSLRTEPQERR
jgi:biopolymer transport protein ExbD